MIHTIVIIVKQFSIKKGIFFNYSRGRKSKVGYIVKLSRNFAI